MGSSLGRLIGGLITILVGITFIPTLADAVDKARFGAPNTTVGGHDTADNITGASSTVTNLVTLFFVLGVLSAGLAVAVGGLKDAGVM